MVGSKGSRVDSETGGLESKLVDTWSQKRAAESGDWGTKEASAPTAQNDVKICNCSNLMRRIDHEKLMSWLEHEMSQKSNSRDWIWREILLQMPWSRSVYFHMLILPTNG